MEDIDTVLARLDLIVASAKQGRSRRGYFAAMYRRVTRRIRAGVLDGTFEDGARMSRLDWVFAARYLEAHDAWSQRKPTSRSWTRAFEATEDSTPLVLSHLLLGMNAHIYFDLGIATYDFARALAKTSPAEPPAEAVLAHYESLKTDFFRINQLLFLELGPTEDKLAQISPWLGLADRVLGTLDERLGEAALGYFRSLAWEFGLALCKADPSAHPQLIDEHDQRVAALADSILPPALVARTLLYLAHLRERRSISDNIDIIG